MMNYITSNSELISFDFAFRVQGHRNDFRRGWGWSLRSEISLGKNREMYYIMKKLESQCPRDLPVSTSLRFRWPGVFNNREALP